MQKHKEEQRSAHNTNMMDETAIFAECQQRTYCFMLCSELESAFDLDRMACNDVRHK
jgi:hypothetical protein